MIRRWIVILLVLAGLGLIIWAGASNYHVREMKKVAAQNPGQQLVLSPNGVATPAAPGDAAGAGMPPSPLLGKMAPDFTLKGTDGKEVSLASLKGRPVLVNFWATWCGPCKFEIPWLVKLQSQYAPQGFEILGIDTDNLDSDSPGIDAATQTKVVKAAQALHIDYPVLYGGEAVANLYGGIDLLPESFYVDRSGRIVAVITGAGSEQEAAADIKKAMGSGA